MRIRSIKPEFWRSDDITSLPIEDRLLFIGLWSYVDDNGVGRDELHLIVADLFPRDHFNDPRETVARVSRGLSNLSAAGLLTRYTADGKPLLHVATWESHQRVDKPNKPRYPLPDPQKHAIRETPAEPSRDSRETLAPGTREQRNKGAEEQGAEEQDMAAPPALVDLDPEPSIDELFDGWWNLYPRKVKRSTAHAAFAKALTRIGGSRPEAARLLAEAAAQHAHLWIDVERRTPDKIPHAATWLNAEQWNDELPDISAYQRARQSDRESSFDRVVRQHQEAAAELAREEDTHGRQGSTRPALALGR